MTRYVALDIHKDYFSVVGLVPGNHIVLEAKKIYNSRLRDWAAKKLQSTDHVVLEMTTNTYLFYDILCPLVASVTVVHPPNVPAVTNAPVKTDLKAAHTLAMLHTAGMLTGVWIPPQEVRDRRRLIAQRGKLKRLSTQAKNRLRATLHSHNILPPDDKNPFHPKHADWWLNLDITPSEKLIVRSDWNVLCFATAEIAVLEEGLMAMAAEDERVPLLTQLPGIGAMSAITILSAIGEISRFKSPEKLVGYAGLGPRVHESGRKKTRGRITKRGRKELRWVMVQAARKAKSKHPRWKKEYDRLVPRIGDKKAIVAVARKMLLSVWHILTDEVGDYHGNPQQIAAGLYRTAYDIGMERVKAANPQTPTARLYTAYHLRRLGLRHKVDRFKWGEKNVTIPELPTPPEEKIPAPI